VAFLEREHPDASRWAINMRIHSAEFCLATRDPDRALRDLEDANVGYNNLGGVPIDARSFCIFPAWRFFVQVSPERALQALDSALAKYLQFKLVEGRADVFHAYGKALEMVHDWESASAIYKRGISTDPNMGQSPRPSEVSIEDTCA